MKKRVTWEKRRRALKKAALIGIVSLSVAVLPYLLTCCGNDPLKPVSDSITIKPADQLINENCNTSCHNLDKVTNYKDNDWKDVVDRMVTYDVKLTDEEAANVIAHLEEGTPF